MIVSKYVLSEKEILSQGKIATIYKGSLSRSGSISLVDEVEEQFFAIKRVELKYLQYCLNEKQFLTILRHQTQYFNEILDIFKTANHVYIVYPYFNQGTFEVFLHNSNNINNNNISNTNNSNNNNNSTNNNNSNNNNMNINISNNNNNINNNSLSIERFLSYISQIISAFLILNDCNIIHRDLRPNNLIIHNGKVKISGFYSAILENSHETSQQILVSPLYMSPEFLKGNKLTQKTDVWSLGVILFEILYGRYPWGLKTEVMDKLQALKKIEEGCEIMEKNREFFFGNDKKYGEDIRNLLVSMLKFNDYERASFEKLSHNPLFSDTLKQLQASELDKNIVRTSTLSHEEEIKEKSCSPKLLARSNFSNFVPQIDKSAQISYKSLEVVEKTVKNEGNLVKNIERLSVYSSKLIDQTIQVMPILLENAVNTQNSVNLEEELHSFVSFKHQEPSLRSSVKSKKPSISYEVGEAPNIFVEELITSLHLRYIPYKFIQPLGFIKAGGQGQVFRAVYNKQEYAVKEIGNVSHETLEKVLREAHNLKNYENPRLIKIYGVSYQKCQFDASLINLYLVFELKEGDLQDVIEKKKINYENKLKIAFQIALGLFHLHNHSTPLVHADLKPSNILIDDSNKVFITDLGISRELKNLDTTGSNACTLGYAAPEQVFLNVSGRKISAKSDIWSLGLLYYYLFFEKKVYPTIYNEIALNSSKSLEINAEMHELREIKELIQKMVVYEPEKRLSVAEVLEGLEIISQNKGVELKSCRL